MRYCALKNLPRLFKHLIISDRKNREKLVAEFQGNYPFAITEYKEARTFSFQLLGDVGEGDDSQLVVTEELEAVQNEIPDTLFCLLLGDVVYPDGSASDYVRRFYVPFRNYRFPVYSITGNHDWYSKLTGFRRHFLEKNPLSEKFNRPTINQPNIYFYIETGPVRILCLDSGKSGKRIDDQQMKWLLEACELEPAGIPKILILHHPLYSEDKRHKIADQLEPVIIKYDIKLVIAAHVHNYQKYLVTDSATGHTAIHLVNGGGGAGISPTFNLRKKKLVEDFYPGVEESLQKFPKILKLFRPPSWLTTCKDDFPYYKSFLNVSVNNGGMDISVYKKKGFGERAEVDSFAVEF